MMIGDRPAAAIAAAWLVSLCATAVDGWEATAIGGWGQNKEKIVLDIFYESKCPDSRKFILEQLTPAMNLLGDYLTLQFVPFGKSKSNPEGFTCQHGPAECLGNRVQDCALHAPARGTLSTDRQQLQYVGCEMATEASTTGSLKCVEDAGIPAAWVQQCVTSPLGRKLQLDSEYRTRLLRPHFVPTVTVNGVFDQDFQDFAQFDLVERLCSLLQRTKPCSQFFNKMALDHILYYQYSFDQ